MKSHFHGKGCQKQHKIGSHAENQNHHDLGHYHLAHIDRNEQKGLQHIFLALPANDITAEQRNDARQRIQRSQGLDPGQIPFRFHAIRFISSGEKALGCHNDQYHAEPKQCHKQHTGTAKFFQFCPNHNLHCVFLTFPKVHDRRRFQKPPPTLQNRVRQKTADRHRALLYWADLLKYKGWHRPRESGTGSSGPR
jgi:hypothetical protein